jgi:hypothetical protein
MFLIKAPYPLLQTTTVLPNPQFSDVEGTLHTMSRKLAMDGTRRTYVKKKDRKKLKWAFKMTRNKSLELRAFIYAYFAAQIQVTDHNDRVWVGYLVNNPFEFDTPASGRPAINPMPRGESVVIDLEFEGVEENA